MFAVLADEFLPLLKLKDMYCVSKLEAYFYLFLFNMYTFLEI